MGMDDVIDPVTTGRMGSYIIFENAMRMIQLVLALTVGFAIANNSNAGTKSVRASVKAQCLRVAAAQDFGKRYFQRRRFIQNCIVDPEFNYPDLL